MPMFTLEEIDLKINKHQEELDMLKKQLHGGLITPEDYYKVANSAYTIINHLNELRVSKLKDLIGKLKMG